MGGPARVAFGLSAVGIRVGCMRSAQVQYHKILFRPRLRWQPFQCHPVAACAQVERVVFPGYAHVNVLAIESVKQLRFLGRDPESLVAGFLRASKQVGNAGIEGGEVARFIDHIKHQWKRCASSHRGCETAGDLQLARGGQCRQMWRGRALVAGDAEAFVTHRVGNNQEDGFRCIRHRHLFNLIRLVMGTLELIGTPHHTGGVKTEDIDRVV